jgi:ribonuclease P/MRP protein subunit RPP1
MKKIYADLNLRADLTDPEQSSGMIKKAFDLGYSLIAVPMPNGADSRFQQLKTICKETGIDLASRVDLKPRSPNDLLQSLRRLRRKVEVIAVLSDSKMVSRQAAKDRRVDILNFPSNDFRTRFFDFQEAELASNSLASLEIDIYPILTLESAAKVRLLSFLRREVEIARAFHVPVILSSGASSAFLMRKPREVAAVASLFDMDKESSLKGVSNYPMKIVEENRKKLDPNFVAPGIRVVRKGTSC